jgi:hypothetical protein
MPYKVYLSDTSTDLTTLRPIIIDQIKQMGLTPVEMDETDRAKPDMLEVARRKIQDADYFISIVTYRRAWEPESQGGKSLAEIEFDLARELSKPWSVLLPKDTSEIGMYLRVRALSQSPASAMRQQQFWKRLEQAGQVSHFTDETDLTRRIMQILRRLASDQEKPTPEAAPAPVLTPPEQQEFIPLAPSDIDKLADRVAEKTAERVEAVQQKRQEDLAKQAVKVNEALRLLPGELVFGRPATGRQFKSDAFMIMPFAASFSGIYVDIVKPLMAELKLTIVRGDEFNSTRGVIMEEVWAALNACRFVIAEISGGNDNVFYELGIAHTLNKPAILITQSKAADGVPFDVRHLRYLRYENTAAGGAQLRDDLKKAVTRLLADLEDGWGNSAGG